MNARLRPLAVNLAADQDLVVPAFEDRFDAGGVLAGPDEVAGGAAAEQEIDRSDENRLARSGFAGQDVQAGVEFDLDRIDDRKVGDREESEASERDENSNPNIGLTAVFARATVDLLTISGLLPRRALSQRRTAYVAEDRLRTLGSLFFALQVEGEGGAVPGSSGSADSRSARQHDYVSRVVLLILALFSVASWAVILYKWWMFRQAERHTAQFLDVFRRSNKFSEVQAVCKSLEDSPLVGLFQSGYAELTAQLRQRGSGATPPAIHSRPPVVLL